MFARALGGEITRSSVARTLLTMVVTAVLSIYGYIYWRDKLPIDDHERTVLVQMIRAIAAEERQDPMQLWQRLAIQNPGTAVWPAQLTHREWWDMMRALAEDVGLFQMVIVPALPGEPVLPRDAPYRRRPN
jgi:hypothetical protein